MIVVEVGFKLNENINYYEEILSSHHAINRFNSYDHEKLKKNSLITFEEKCSKEKNMELFRKIYESGKVY